ncbi:MAG: metal ABC transporter ATP-binding protein [Chloroflexi bacterium]|nr:metal ABC transporter ATP-binding protein [Chloroflexota bacterium]MBU1751828.1 metal ABC transporter ATP-binding protein [Chloroflexota bacterium]MBU1877889.1 metal ABC transporter ATP-binding protein [Chloroflexota bacterium]
MARSHRWHQHEPTAPVLELADVSVRYDGTVALEHISLRVEPGARVAVVGPNGAGKSTLFKAVAGVIQAASGTIRVYGHGPGGHICIGYVPQRSHVDWDFPANVRDVVMMGRTGKLGLFRWPRRADWDVVRHSLEQVGMQDLAHKQIGELSGGQQQRVFIARALAQEAELLLMDEPLTGLDTPAQEDILHILTSLQAQGVTMLVATHDLDLAAQHFDQVLLLNRRLIGFGPPPAVFTPDNLRAAYGGHVTLLDTDEGTLVIGDTCCGDQEG